MESSIKNSIDARKNAIYNSYTNLSQNYKEKVETLFNKINELGESCNNLMDFETKFSTSTLNQEYITLFTEIATNNNSTLTPNSFDDEKDKYSYEEKEIMNELEYQLDNATLDARSKVREEIYDKARNIKGIGEILEAKQHFDFFQKFKKDKKD